MPKIHLKSEFSDWWICKRDAFEGVDVSALDGLHEGSSEMALARLHQEIIFGKDVRRSGEEKERGNQEHALHVMSDSDMTKPQAGRKYRGLKGR